MWFDLYVVMIRFEVFFYGIGELLMDFFLGVVDRVSIFRVVVCFGVFGFGGNFKNIEDFVLMGIYEIMFVCVCFDDVVYNIY